MRLAAATLCLLALGACRTSFDGQPGRPLAVRLGLLGDSLRGFFGHEAGRDFGVAETGMLVTKELQPRGTPEGGEVMYRFLVDRNLDGLRDVHGVTLAKTLVVGPKVERPAGAPGVFEPDNPLYPANRLPRLEASVTGFISHTWRLPSLDWEQPKPKLGP
ncbi:MAG: hypothetical protein R3F30_07535 [Planctomycetota bacterium]